MRVSFSNQLRRIYSNWTTCHTTKLTLQYLPRPVFQWPGGCELQGRGRELRVDTSLNTDSATDRRTPNYHHQYLNVSIYNSAHSWALFVNIYNGTVCRCEWHSCSTCCTVQSATDRRTVNYHHQYLNVSIYNSAHSWALFVNIYNVNVMEFVWRCEWHSCSTCCTVLQQVLESTKKWDRMGHNTRAPRRG